MDLRQSVNWEHLNLYNVTYITLALNVFPLSTINWSGPTLLVDIAWKILKH